MEDLNKQLRATKEDLAELQKEHEHLQYLCEKVVRKAQCNTFVTLYDKELHKIGKLLEMVPESEVIRRAPGVRRSDRGRNFEADQADARAAVDAQEKEGLHGGVDG